MAETKDSAQVATSEHEENLTDASQPYVGRWNQLVSSTNWEKGRIIAQWRQALIDSDAPAGDYSDEAWSLKVGGVTGQHVGRLRRVYMRFGEVYSDYDGLYWSHFQAALDWDDAEMWLEGAVQNNWSVSQMRRTRWEANGALDDQQPNDLDIISSETDEDFEPVSHDRPDHSVQADRYTEVQGPPIPEGPDFGDEDDAAPSAENEARSNTAASSDEPIDYVQPFQDLPELPADLADAFDSFKLAILRHKAEKWGQVARDDVLAALDALKMLATAPSPAMG